MSGYSQILQALTITAVPPSTLEEGAMGVTDLRVITEPDGAIGVNFTATNVHAVNPSDRFTYWVAMRVRE
ncbi:hypothetical protein HEK616_83990 (plasmid) [Streptomyces nigrescens]|uniref:Uncharacterized protein n=1 Tax=Streptomyces nigrescens TaxID=1920 RepID=A0ABM8A8C6_STRNI|nr:hypothetical protein HEK616_83990 [Streptomyces nigrescens]